jgi:hypothetical protein
MELRRDINVSLNYIPHRGGMSMAKHRPTFQPIQPRLVWEPPVRTEPVREVDPTVKAFILRDGFKYPLKSYKVKAV